MARVYSHKLLMITLYKTNEGNIALDCSGCLLLLRIYEKTTRWLMRFDT